MPTHSTEQSEVEIVRADQLASILQIAKSTVYAMAKEGQIPSIGIGKTGVRFDLQEVMTALKK